MQLICASWVSIGGRAIFSVDIHPDGSRFATGGQGEDSTGKVVIWNMQPVVSGENGEQKEQSPHVLCEMNNHLGCVNCVRWSHSGRYLASCSDDKLIMIWHISKYGGGSVFGSGEQRVNVEQWKVAATLRGHSQDVLHVAWSPHDRYLATCGVDNTVIIWNAAKFAAGIGDQVTVIRKHTSFVKGVAWDPVGKYLASQSEDKTLRIFNTEEWRQVKCVEEPFEECGGTTHVLRLDWSPLGDVLVSAHALNNNGSTAQIITRSNWSTKLDYVGHRKAVTCVRFHPKPFKQDNNGKQKQSLHSVIAVGSKDKGISVWTTSRSRPLVVLGKVFKEPVMDISWNPVGLGFLACSLDGRCVYAQFTTGELGKPCSQQEVSEWYEKQYKISSSSSLMMMNGPPLSNGSLMDTDDSSNKWSDAGSGKKPAHQQLFPTSAHDLEVVEDRKRKAAAADNDSDRDSLVSRKMAKTGGPSRQSEVKLPDGRRRITPLYIPPTMAQDGTLPAPFGSNASDAETTSSMLRAASASKPATSASTATTATAVPTTAGTLATTATTTVASGGISKTSSDTSAVSVVKSEPADLMASRMATTTAPTTGTSLTTQTTSITAVTTAAGDSKSKQVSTDSKKDKKSEAKLSIKSFVKKETESSSKPKEKHKEKQAVGVGGEKKRSRAVAAAVSDLLGDSDDDMMTTAARSSANVKRRRRAAAALLVNDDDDDVESEQERSGRVGKPHAQRSSAAGNRLQHNVAGTLDDVAGQTRITTGQQPVYKVQKEISMESDIDGTPHLVVCANSGHTGHTGSSRVTPACKLTLMNRQSKKPVWSRNLNSAAVNVAFNKYLMMVACTAGKLYLVNVTSGQLLCPLQALPAHIAMISVYNHYIALLTAPPHNTVYSWQYSSVSARGSGMSLVSEAPLPYLGTSTTVRRLLVSEHGLVVACLSNGDNWGLHPAYRTWSYLCRSNSRTVAHTPSTSLTQPVTLAMLRLGQLSPGQSRDASEQLDSIVLEELEEQLQAAILLRSSHEYLQILHAYVRKLLHRGESTMLSSVYKSLLTKSATTSTTSSRDATTSVLDIIDDTDSDVDASATANTNVLGVDEHKVLSDLLVTHRDSGKLVSLYSQYKRVLGQANNTHHR